jgi:tetratricopeptide (TPR) repeat protein
MQTAVLLNPNNAGYYTNYAKILLRQQKTTEALSLLNQALQVLPNNIDILTLCANVYEQQGDLYKAKLHLAVLYYHQQQYEKAVATTQELIAEKPDNSELYYNLGSCYIELAQFESAIQAFQKSLALNPNKAETHWNLSLVLLLTGQFQQGWQEYEYRWQRTVMLPYRYNFTQPVWDGRKLPTKETLLIAAEQGLGDAIQFMRYVPLVHKRVKNIIVQCAPELLSLFAHSFPDIKFVNREEATPHFDYYIPLLTLAKIFDTNLSNIPQQVPYLSSSKKHPTTKSKKLFKIGIAWAGNSQHGRDMHRSIALAKLSPLFNTPHTEFYSFQKNPGVEIAEYKKQLIDLDKKLHTFDDTAYYINQMDLMITVDTALAHLAGALAKPVWIMLAKSPDWRWQLNREDSPWYPTARLFRQQQRADWTSVITSMQQELGKLVGK